MCLFLKGERGDDGGEYRRKQNRWYRRSFAEGQRYRTDLTGGLVQRDEMTMLIAKDAR